MGSPILGSSDLPTIGENMCSRKWLNKTEEPKFVPTYQTKQGFKITLNRELSTKPNQKNSLPLTAHESQLVISKIFTSHQNKVTHSVPKS